MLCLTSGAILCATDPVAVVALLKQLGASPTLTVQIQGESLLNDGTAIVLYTISYNILKGEVYDFGDILQLLVKMAIYAWGLGMLIGFVFFLWIKAANNKLDHSSSVIQASLTICCCYTSFVVAEGAFHISGVLSTVAAALVLAHKMWPHVVSDQAMLDTWHMLEYLGNSIIFFLAGALTGSVMARIQAEDYVHLIVIYVTATFIRGSLIFFSRPLLDNFAEDSQSRITAADALVMTWGGLRGAIGLALAIQVQMERADGRVTEADADRVLFYVSGIAALTLLINATSSPGLVKWLGITQLPATKKKLMQIINSQLLALALNKHSDEDIRHTIYEMLEDVNHHIVCDEDHGEELVEQLQSKRADALHHKVSLRRSKHDVMRPKNHRRASEDSDEDEEDYRFLPLIQPGVEGTTYAQVLNGNKIVAELDHVKSLFSDNTMDCLQDLSELPEMPLLDQEANLGGLVLDYVTEPAIQRAINEAFLSLVRACYWEMNENREFSSFDGEFAHLLGSVELALSTPLYDLNDFTFIEKFVGISVTESKNRLTFITGYKPISTRMRFHVAVAVFIVLNTLFVYVEQNVSISDEDGGANFWLGMEIMFATVFTLEFLMKLWDQHLSYFFDPWNIFDFLLVILGIVGLIFTLLTDLAAESDTVGQARMVRTAQIFRMLRIMRLFRLMRFFQVFRAKAASKNVDFNLCEHIQKLTILCSFVRAHISSQKLLVKYFGDRGEVDSVEVARCLLQSQISCYRAMLLAINERSIVGHDLVDELRSTKEAKHILVNLDKFVCDAHCWGVLSHKEAECILHTLHEHVAIFIESILDIQQGRLVENAETNSLQILKEKPSDDEVIPTAGIINQVLQFRYTETLAARANREIRQSQSGKVSISDKAGMPEFKASVFGIQMTPECDMGGDVFTRSGTNDSPPTDGATEEPAPEPNLEPATPPDSPPRSVPAKPKRELPSSPQKKAQAQALKVQASGQEELYLDTAESVYVGAVGTTKEQRNTEDSAQPRKWGKTGKARPQKPKAQGQDDKV